MKLSLGLGLSSARAVPGGVALSTDTSLSVFTVDGEAVTDEGTLNRANSYVGTGIGGLTIVATPTHPGATVGTKTITPDPLGLGDNQLDFDVTAEDGVTVQHYNVTLHVLTAGVAEVTSVTCLDDTAGNRHNTNFRIYNASGQVAVVLNCGARAEVTVFGFNGFSVNSMSGGKYLLVPLVGGGIRCYWFNVEGGQTQPDASGEGATTYTEVVSTIPDPDPPDGVAIAGIFATVIGGTSFEHQATMTQSVGAVQDAFDSAVQPTGASVSVTTQGRSAAGAVGGVTSIIVGITDGDTGDAIADKIGVATNAQGWTTTTTPGNPVIFTDSAVGARTNASNNGAVSSITVTTQGADPS